MVEVDSKEEADDIDRQCFVFVVKTLQKIGVVDIICFILLVFLELWPSRQRAHQTFPSSKREIYYGKPNRSGPVVFLWLILGSKRTHSSLVCLRRREDPPKNVFWEIFLKSGWVGWRLILKQGPNPSKKPNRLFDEILPMEYVWDVLDNKRASKILTLQELYSFICGNGIDLFDGVFF